MMYLFSVLCDQTLIPNGITFGQCNSAISLPCLRFYFYSSFYLELFLASIIPQRCPLLRQHHHSGNPLSPNPMKKKTPILHQAFPPPPLHLPLHKTRTLPSKINVGRPGLGGFLPVGQVTKVINFNRSRSKQA